MRPLLLLLLLCLSIPNFAQEDIILGEALQISIAANKPTLQTYQGRAGESLQISAEAIDAGENTPDLVLWLVLEGQLLAYNDNQGENNNPQIRLTLPENGLYQIYLDSFNGVSEGQANLLIETYDPFNLTVDENRLLLDLPAAEVFRHEFEAEGEITIRAKDLSGTLDPYLRLFNSAGELVAENDDHTSSDFSLGLFDSRLSLTLDADTYTLEIRDFLANTGQLEILFN